MGYYIDGPVVGKAEHLIKQGAQRVPTPKNFADIPADKALIIVTSSGFFEAAGLAFDAKEYDEFTLPGDARPKIFLLMDKTKAHRLAGYKEHG